MQPINVAVIGSGFMGAAHVDGLRRVPGVNVMAISSIDRHSPPLNAYAVSQYVQRNGQPVSRTKTVGQPLDSASPWIERKISEILRRNAASASSPSTRATSGSVVSFNRRSAPGYRAGSARVATRSNPETPE